MERRIFSTLILGLAIASLVAIALAFAYSPPEADKLSESNAAYTETSWKTWVGAAALIVLFTIETTAPLFPGRKNRLWHTGRNLLLAAINIIPTAIIVTLLLVHVDEVWRGREWGLLNAAWMPAWLGIIGAVVLFDGWMYLWHRANHVVPFLWRFHRMHHSDPEMDASTAFRFHPGEIAISTYLRVGVLALLGISFQSILFYEALLLPVILFHHSNIHMPGWLDKPLRAVIVTPWIHQVHHSRIQRETDSNYSSLFSWWDRMAKTLKFRSDLRTIDQGLDGWDHPRHLSLWGMMKTPFRRK